MAVDLIEQENKFLSCVSKTRSECSDDKGGG